MTENRGENDEAAHGASERSGPFSKDPRFDPAEWFAVLEHDQSAKSILGAMAEFQRHGDQRLLERAIAVYVRSARARDESVETVLGTLQQLADKLERDAPPGFADRDTPLRHMVLRGVLLAFYGPDVVRREAKARQDRVERRRASGEERPGDASE